MRTVTGGTILSKMGRIISADQITNVEQNIATTSSSHQKRGGATRRITGVGVSKMGNKENGF